jgi:hypothetical protein
VPGEPVDNGSLVRWKQFLRHVERDEPFPYGFLSGAKGVQLAEAGPQSWRERRYVEIPEVVVEAVAI